ncbi:uncharacterized protein SCHCODRAFT_02484153 [Schizophyllum commune H4-8]|nr:uncharacterized protein SCHCODRAFT_02484153 [Schizophyllum commune H4-8]KAI5899401.1 hypothetical protein SCHCODRAFT_02484153 [Schizophyllum commune H4-8]
MSAPGVVHPAGVDVVNPASLHSRHSSWDIVRRVASHSRASSATSIERVPPSKWTPLRTVLSVLLQLFPRFHRPIRKRALLIGIAYQNRLNPDERLNGTHEDVDCLYELLINHYGFLPRDITVMKDADDVEDHLWPTEDNIRRELQALTRDCAPRDRFFFSYAGHASQKEERVKGSEIDGMDEFIVPYDASDFSGSKCILDDELRRYLVDPLKRRCRLVAVLDACHSATLLDLAHDRCIERDGWKGFVTTTVRWAWEHIAIAMGFPVPDPEASAAAQQAKREEMQDLLSQTLVPFIEKLLGPWRYCWGFCRRAVWPHEPYVLCFSACRDEQMTFEKRGFSMTKVLAKKLGKILPRLGSLTRNVRAEFTAVYEAKREKYETFLDRGVRRKHTLGIAYWILPESLRGEEAPPYMLPPPLAKLQLTSNLPRYTNLERFWI